MVEMQIIGVLNVRHVDRITEWRSAGPTGLDSISRPQPTALRPWLLNAGAFGAVQDLNRCLVSEVNV